MDAEHADGAEPGTVVPVEGGKTLARQATPMRWPVSIRVFCVHLRASALNLACFASRPTLPRGCPGAIVTRQPHSPVSRAPIAPTRRAAPCQNLMHRSAGHTPPHAECCRDGSAPRTVRHGASAVAASIPISATGEQNPARVTASPCGTGRKRAAVPAPAASHPMRHRLMIGETRRQ